MRPGVFGGLVGLAGTLFVVAFALSAFRAEPRPDATPSLGVLADPAATYDPYVAGEQLPDGYAQLLRRDSILPVYDPLFVTAAEAGWSHETLVIGVAAGDEGRAYPIAFLNRREMVVDELGGIPLLVSW